MKLAGNDMLIQSLVDEGVEFLFGYPGGAALHIYDAIFNQNELQHILVRHEQGATHAADGYARATGKPGVVLVTSGPGATNAITGIATAFMDSIPMVVLSGQVASHLIGTDAFQETDMIGISRPIVKHSFSIESAEEIPRVIKEAFHIATTGRPGPVLIDIPKDIQLSQCTVDWDADMNLPGYRFGVIDEPPAEQLNQVAAAIKHAKRPLIYAGGGIITGEATNELRELIAKTEIPTTLTVMGLGAFPATDPLCMDMLGMHGSIYANWAVRDCDLLIGLGVRFDDRVTGKLEKFARNAKIVHIDIDPSELNKNKPAHIPIVSDVKIALQRRRCPNVSGQNAPPDR